MSAESLVRDLAGFLLPEGRGLLVMLRAYFDDSGTHDGSRIVVMGGLVGTPTQWTLFDEQWKAKLAEPLKDKPQLSSFSLGDCARGRNEFRSYTEPERDWVRHDFRQIIIEIALIGVAFAIDGEAWRELVVGRYRKELGSALQNCAEQCVAYALQCAEPHPEGDAVAVMFDAGINGVGAIVDRIAPMTYPLGRPRLATVGIGSVPCVRPLQGADTVATEYYWHTLESKRIGGVAEPAHTLPIISRGCTTTA